MTSDAILERLLSLHPKSIDLSLDRVERLLSDLGSPHLNLPPVLHVAGTNGKGSVVALCDSILRAGALRVHRYISPHLARFHERIQLDGASIGEDALMAVLDECERVNAGAPITFFEITTAAAFLAFARHPADAVVLETGLGGRLDATNVVPAPAATAITPIGMDHEHMLGPTLQDIAREKAGIFRRGVPAVIGRQSQAARTTLESQADRAGAPLFIQDQDFQSYEERGDRMVYLDPEGLIDLPRPGLMGRHQVDNAGLAIAAIRQAARTAPALAMPDSAVAQGLTEVRWPARLQRLSTGPLAEIAQRHRRPNQQPPELWLDGAHNAHAAAALAQFMADREAQQPAPLHIVIGMMERRDPDDILRPFQGLAAAVSAVPVPDQAKAAAPESIVAAAEALGLPAQVHSSVGAAVETALKKEATRVLITGSLYLAGSVLAAGNS